MNKQNNQETYRIPLVTSNVSYKKDISVLKGIIGQKEVLKKLSFFINSHSEEMPTPTMIFTGSQGLGKSFMARKMAEALGRKLVEVNCGNIVTASDFIEKILLDKVLGDKPVTLFFDEAHQLSQEITTVLLSLLNPNVSNKTIINYKNFNIEYNFSNINTIFATTDAHKIFKPLLNRCAEIYFSLYSNDDLYDIVKSYIPDIKITCDKEDIAYACRGRARDAFQLSQNIKRHCIIMDTKCFNDKGLEEIKDTFGIHSYGLNTQEVTMLKILKLNSPLSSNNIAIKMGLNVQNIESEIETRPKELGFVSSCSKGRFLTEEGIKFIEDLA